MLEEGLRAAGPETGGAALWRMEMYRRNPPFPAMKLPERMGHPLGEGLRARTGEAVRTRDWDVQILVQADQV